MLGSEIEFKTLNCPSSELWSTFEKLCIISLTLLVKRFANSSVVSTTPASVAQNTHKFPQECLGINEAVFSLRFTGWTSIDSLG
ncbi:hypothetical protein HanPSC8_Chr17g0763941 [Helianthus annuus]|nr:hypothetical protein HanPSC8_Chr17g0763941 [Helianthus annuus]